MKAVIFGGSGFLGSHIADTLSERGYKVRIFDLKRSEYLIASQEMLIGDIMDAQGVKEAVGGCDYVYNFAGITDMDNPGTVPLDTIDQNIKGNANILEAARLAKAKRFVYASTIYVYSNKGGFYRCSKQAAESYIEEYQRKYGLPFTILRYGTLYGPRADLRNSIYRYVHQALKDKRISCSGCEDALREYIHVKDAAKLSVDILDEQYKNQYIIISGHHPIKFMDLLKTIQEICNNKIEIKFSGTEDNDHYNTTPFSFTPKLGNKLTTNYYTDIGQGILGVLEEVFRKLNSDKGK